MEQRGRGDAQARSVLRQSATTCRESTVGVHSTRSPASPSKGTTSTPSPTGDDAPTGLGSAPGRLWLRGCPDGLERTAARLDSWAAAHVAQKVGTVSAPSSRDRHGIDRSHCGRGWKPLSELAVMRGVSDGAWGYCVAHHNGVDGSASGCREWR